MIINQIKLPKILDIAEKNHGKFVTLTLWNYGDLETTGTTPQLNC